MQPRLSCRVAQILFQASLNPLSLTRRIDLKSDWDKSWATERMLRVSCTRFRLAPPPSKCSQSCNMPVYSVSCIKTRTMYLRSLSVIASDRASEDEGGKNSVEGSWNGSPRDPNALKNVLFSAKT